MKQTIITRVGETIIPGRLKTGERIRKVTRLYNVAIMEEGHPIDSHEGINEEELAALIVLV